MLLVLWWKAMVIKGRALGSTRTDFRKDVLFSRYMLRDLQYLRREYYRSRNISRSAENVGTHAPLQTRDFRTRKTLVLLGNIFERNKQTLANN